MIKLTEHGIRYFYSFIVILLFIPPTSLAQITFEQHEISNDFNACFYMGTADLDGDGDEDLYGTDYWDNNMSWWENVDNGTSWIENSISTNCASPKSIWSVDLDSDGDIDLVNVYHAIGQFMWWENSDNGATWTQHVLIDDDSFAGGIFPSDIDGDGDQDLVLGYEGNSNITWLENTGDMEDWPEHTIAWFFTATFIYAEDLDGDGDQDVVATNFNTGHVFWWQNEDNGANWTEGSVIFGFEGAKNVIAAQINDDEYFDVICPGYNLDVIDWFEFDPDNTSWIQQSTAGTFDAPQTVKAADLDNDGDIDLVGSAYDGDKISWLENVDYGDEWIEHELILDYDGAGGVAIADLNGDGSMDIITAAVYENSIHWWENSLNLNERPPAPLLNLPENNAVDLDTTMITFNWIGDQDVDGYHLQVSEDSMFVTIAAEADSHFIPVFSVTDLRGGTEYYWHVRMYNEIGYGEWSVMRSFTTVEPVNGVDNQEELPGDFAISALYPNPFNSSATLTVSLPESANLKVCVFDVSGRELMQVTEGSYPTGLSRIGLNGSNLTSGVFIIRVAHSDGRTLMKKAVLIK